jgi:hypothetical protein
MGIKEGKSVLEHTPGATGDAELTDGAEPAEEAA